MPMAYTFTPQGGSAIDIAIALSVTSTGSYLLRRMNPLSWQQKETINDSPVSDGSYIRFFGKKARKLTQGCIMIVDHDASYIQTAFDNLEEKLKTDQILCDISDSDVTGASYSNVRITTLEYIRESGGSQRIFKSDGNSRAFVLIEGIQLSD